MSVVISAVTEKCNRVKFFNANDWYGYGVCYPVDISHGYHYNEPITSID